MRSGKAVKTRMRNGGKRRSVKATGEKKHRMVENGGVPCPSNREQEWGIIVAYLRDSDE